MATTSFDALHTRSEVSVLARWMYFDPLHEGEAARPNPLAVLISSALLGLMLIAVHSYARRFGLQTPMFHKEGFAENLTFMLFLWAGFLSAFAAARERRRDDAARWVRRAYSTCAACTFFIAFEEISWGQQLVSFHTPPAWGAINYQDETTLHNLFSRDALTEGTRVIAVLFAVGALSMMAAAAFSSQRLLHCIAPHPSLAPLAVLIGYAGLRVHAEVAEVLLSIFFAFYAYRIYVASASPIGRGVA